MFGLYAQADNPPKKKRKKGRHAKKRGGAYSKFQKCYYMTHKGSGLRAKTVAAAWKRHKKALKRKGHTKLTKAQKKRITKLIRSVKKHHGKGMTAAKYGKLLARQADFEAGIGTRPLSPSESKKVSAFTRRLQSLEKARAVGAARRAEKKSRATYVGSGYGETPGVTVGLNRRKKKGRRSMSKRKKGYGRLLAMNAPALAAGRMTGVFSGFNLGNITGLVPVIGGAIANGILKGIIQPRLPGFMQRGIGGIATGLLTSGVVGGIGYAFLGPRIGAGMLKGGVIETGAQAFLTARDQGFAAAFGLGGVDYGHWLENGTMSGMGFPPRPGTTMPYAAFSPGLPPGHMRDYADPRQINAAMNTDGMQTAQYPLPQPGVVPMTTVPPGHPGHHHTGVPAGAPSQVHPQAEAEAVHAVMNDLGADIF